MLTKEELARRLKAARTLRGLEQADLSKLVKADGLGTHDVGRLERGEITLTRALRESLTHHLQVPTEWFTEPELDLVHDPAIPVEQVAGLIDQHDLRMRELFDDIVRTRDISLERVVSRLSELSTVAQMMQSSLTEALERMDRQAADLDLQRDLLPPGRADRGTGTSGP